MSSVSLRSSFERSFCLNMASRGPLFSSKHSKVKSLKTLTADSQSQASDWTVRVDASAVENGLSVILSSHL